MHEKINHLPASNHPTLEAGDSVNGQASRRPLTPEEIARFLAFAECGRSLREASAAIGRNHSTLLKRMKSDRELGRAFRAAREKGRQQPLNQIREASRSSWRAAAWLVKYLDARRERGTRAPAGPRRSSSTKATTPQGSQEEFPKALSSPKFDVTRVTSCDIPCPNSADGASPVG